MVSALVTPPWPTGLITLSEWDALPTDDGLRLECSEGVLIANPSPRLVHQVASVRLAGIMQAQLPDFLVVPEVDMLLNDVPLTIRTPDLVVVARDLLAEDPPRILSTDVLLAVEVISPGSRRTDRITKRSEYAEAGTAIYWVVDLDAGTVTCHRDPQGEDYLTTQVFHGSAVLPGPGTDVRLDVAALKQA